MKIGDITLKNNLILAPMAGFSNPAMRRLMAENGAGLTVTEMISVKGLIFGSERTEELLKTADCEEITCVQLFGKEPQDFCDCLKLPALQKFDIIDINMGCPVKKIVSNGEGSALIKDKARATEIVAAVKGEFKTENTFDKSESPSINSFAQNLSAQSHSKILKEAAARQKPFSGMPIKSKARAVTVKTRFAEDCDGQVDVAKTLDFLIALQAAGADMITIHARTPRQMYSGIANYALFAELKRKMNVPMTLSGDITDILSYQKAAQTGADFLMIGRGAVANPTIFAALTGTQIKSKHSLVLSLMEYMRQDFGEKHAVKALRKFLPYLLKGENCSKEQRHKMNFIDDFSELKSVLSNNLLANLPRHI